MEQWNTVDVVVDACGHKYFFILLPLFWALLGEPSVALLGLLLSILFPLLHVTMSPAFKIPLPVLSNTMSASTQLRALDNDM